MRISLSILTVTGRAPRRTAASRWGRGVTAVIVAAGMMLHASASAATLVEVAEFGSNPGNLNMWIYRPDNLAAGAPLVVALHGCRQSATAYDDETGWVELADELGFALLLPEQKTGLWSGNNTLGCFNWFYVGDQRRGRGEALSIKEMIDKAVADLGSDTERVYVTGLSAGGAMTTVMLAAYPEMFAGGAIVAGIPYGCSEVPSYVPLVSIAYASVWLGFTDPFLCMEPGIDRTADYWAERVQDANAPAPPRWPVVSIWHGTADATVAPQNADELVEQWTGVHGADAQADLEESGDGYIRRVYRDSAARAVVELYLIAGMGHGVPVHPAVPAEATSPAERCGKAADYVLAVGLCAARRIADFWGLTPP